MENLAPQITRQRLLIEGYYEIEVTEETVRNFFENITKALDLRVYGEPIIHSPEGEGKEDNEGYDAFVPLIDSGISLYVWCHHKFFAVVLFTCKSFDEKMATEVTRTFFKSERISAQSF